MMSLTAHGALLGGAVLATAGPGELGPRRAADTTNVVFLVEKPASAPEPAAQLSVAETPTLVTAVPPPLGFQTLEVPTDIPTGIPDIDLTERFDPRDFTGRGVEGGVFDGVAGGTGPVDVSRAFSAAMVDEQPERLSGPLLKYPPVLRHAGIQGWVLVDFVVDTTGHVEPASVRVRQSTNGAFDAPALEVITKSRYRPGRIRGVAVRVLVRQRVDFSIVGLDERGR